MARERILALRSSSAPCDAKLKQRCLYIFLLTTSLFHHLYLLRSRSYFLPIRIAALAPIPNHFRPIIILKSSLKPRLYKLVMAKTIIGSAVSRSHHHEYDELATQTTPPKLKRARPDMCIGQKDSICDRLNALRHGINGPPVSTNSSFYFHHLDPDFEKLLPQVDRSRYGRSDESEPEPASQNSVQSGTSRIRNAAFSQPASTDRKKKTFARPSQCRKNTSEAMTPEYVYSNNPPPDPSSARNTTLKSVLPNFKKPLPTPTPTVTVTRVDKKQSSGDTSEHQHTSAPITLLYTTDLPIDLRDTQDTYNTMQSFSILVPQDTYLPNTQETSTSSQKSETFSAPATFLPSSPPTQEDLQGTVLSHIKLEDANISATTRKRKARTLFRSSQSFARPSSSSAPSLGKRSRKVLEVEDEVPLHKRTQFT